MKLRRIITCLAIALPIATFSAMPVNANGHKDGPQGPKGKQDKTDSLYTSAEYICVIGEKAYTACELWLATDGHRIDEPGNKCTADDSGDPDLIYSGRNCNLNEETLLRDAASIVLQTDDAIVLSVDEGEDPQPKWCEVRASLGSYYDTFYELTTDGKLSNLDTEAADKIGELESLIAKISGLVDDMIGVEGEIGSYNCSGI